MKILGIAPLTPAWHVERRSSITATDVPKILGVSDYGTGLDVWARITDKLEPEELDARDRPWLEWGNRTEEMHRHWIGELAGVAVSCSPGLVQHPTIPWLKATPDGLYINDAPDGGDLGQGPDISCIEWDGCLETKAPGPWSGFDPEDDAPLGFQAQVAAQLACTGLDEAILSSLTWPGPKWSRFERQQGVIDDLLSGLTDWWEAHVVKDVMPPVVGRDLDTLKKMWPKDCGRIIEFAPTLDATVQSYLAAEEAVKAVAKKMRDAKAERDRHEAKLRAAMGDATFAQYGDLAFKCGTVDRKSYTVDATRYRTFQHVKEIK